MIKLIKLSELQVKEIIVIESGSRLGHISDLEIDVVNGRVLALIIQVKEGKNGMFGKSGEVIIGWHQITTIGEDVILVQLKENQLLLSSNPTFD
ncbi:YlmC/YmxH family sporulation protein [Virgibacillus flavescens]|uniref:YlmC/YmxH family sporulation protein n=1 Tax=Virgibacillus flavescens TaxID=1611422 RepID=UPI003D32B690